MGEGVATVWRGGGINLPTTRMNGKLTNSYYWRIGRSYLALEDKFEYQSSWKEAKERK